MILLSNSSEMNTRRIKKRRKEKRGAKCYFLDIVCLNSTYKTFSTFPYVYNFIRIKDKCCSMCYFFLLFF